MSKSVLLLSAFCVILLLHPSTQKETKLTGTPISSDYSSPLISNPFDGNINTEFKSSQSSKGWVGLKLDSKYLITKIGFALKTNDKSDFLLGVFEGSNDITFIESYTLSMILDGEPNKLNYLEVKVSKKFKYIRYIGPNKKYCPISLLEIYTDEEKDLEEDSYYYQPTNIPLVTIHTEESIEPYDKDHYITCTILITDKNKKNIQATAGIRLRGNSTSRLDKKPYRLKFDNKIQPLSLSANAKSWTLLANHSDKTLIRTLVGLKISTLFEMTYTPKCQLVDLILNGEYIGNYGLCDLVEKHKGRVEVTDMDKTCIKKPEVTGGYFFTADAYAAQEGYFYNTTRGIIYTIKYPEQSDIVKEQVEYFTNFFNELESEVYDNNTVDKVDIYSFSKYILISDITANGEAFWSCYMTKERNDERFHFGPAWDMDLTFDNDMRVYPTLAKKDFIFKYGTTSGTMKYFAEKVLANQDVINALKEVWGNYKSKIAPNILVDFINEQVKNIDESQKLNFMRWDILNKQVLVNPVVRGSYEAEVDYLRYYIKARYDILNELVENLTPEKVLAKVENENKVDRRVNKYFDNIDFL